MCYHQWRVKSAQLVQTWMARVIAKLIHQSLKQWTPVHFSLKNPTKQNPLLKDIYLKA